MTSTVYTIGYEGADLGDFIDTLSDVGVAHVIDIRDVPASRKRGFSKTVLSASLDESGIRYTHLRPLGDPKCGREAMRRGDYPAFLDIYMTHVAKPEAQESLGAAFRIAMEDTSVLLCYERDPKHCHRTLVAGMMKELGSLTVKHLGVRSGRERKRAFQGNVACAVG